MPVATNASNLVRRSIAVAAAGLTVAAASACDEPTRRTRAPTPAR